jgi:glutamate/tyrosine decarboxylase-like PLP-dependent enzyme
MTEDPLAVDAETMRRLGYQTVDWLVERAARRRDEPVLVEGSPEAMAALVPNEAPAAGESLDEMLPRLADVLHHRSRIDHPRYLAYIPGESTWPGALGDLVASTYNIDVGNWQESAGPTQLELTVLRWFADWIGYPATASGVLVSGGSAANLTALACAREAAAGAMRDDLVAYVSAQGHSSLARAARSLGFRPQQVRVLPVDEDYRMRPEALAAAVTADLAAGRTPLVVMAVAGTTNTGAVDRLPEIAALCRRYGVWLHVDAAYGGFAAITDRGRRRLSGIELADSVTLDPHKWFYQPFECGAVLVRDGHLLPKAFEIHPDYLQDTLAQDTEVNLADHGLQLTRMSRALKIWMSVRYFGFDAFVAAVDRSLDLAEHVQALVEGSDELELVAPAALGVVCFRRHPAGVDDEQTLERLNVALVEDLARSGEGLVSSTRLSGRYAIRACVLNHSTTRADVEQVLRRLETSSLPADRPRPTLDVAVDGGGSSAGVAAPPVAVDRLRHVALLAGVAPDRLTWLAAVGRRRRVPAGATVVRQWDVDRDFFLLLAGDAEIVGVDGHLAMLHAGDFFGELAALDWGAGFGYPRLATVQATTELELLVLPDAALAELMAREPGVDARVRAVAGRRAARI